MGRVLAGRAAKEGGVCVGGFKGVGGEGGEPGGREGRSKCQERWAAGAGVEGGGEEGCGGRGGQATRAVRPWRAPHSPLLQERPRRCAKRSKLHRVDGLTALPCGPRGLRGAVTTSRWRIYQHYISGAVPVEGAAVRLRLEFAFGFR